MRRPLTLVGLDDELRVVFRGGDLVGLDRRRAGDLLHHLAVGFAAVALPADFLAGAGFGFHRAAPRRNNPTAREGLRLKARKPSALGFFLAADEALELALFAQGHPQLGP